MGEGEWGLEAEAEGEGETWEIGGSHVGFLAVVRTWP